MVKSVEQVRSLGLFLELLEKGSLTAVANEKDLSVAALSKQLSGLEEKLGIVLFRRNRRGMELTEVGHLFLPYVQAIFESQYKATQFLNAYQQTPQGKMKILSGQFFAEVFLIPFLSEFLALYPHINLELETAENVKNLCELQVDLAFGGLPISNDNWIAKPFLKTDYVLCASPKYLNAFGYPKRVEDLSAHHYITHLARKSDNLLKIGQKSIHLTPKLSVNNAHTMLLAALSGVGIVSLHRYIVKEFLESGQLVPLFEEFKTEPKQIYLFYSEEARRDAKVQGFIQFIESKKSSFLM